IGTASFAMTFADALVENDASVFHINGVGAPPRHDEMPDHQDKEEQADEEEQGANGAAAARAQLGGPVARAVAAGKMHRGPIPVPVPEPPNRSASARAVARDSFRSFHEYNTEIPTMTRLLRAHGIRIGHFSSWGANDRAVRRVRESFRPGVQR